MSEVFKVLTLNCWGIFIPCATVRKDDRIKAITQKLTDGVYEVVLLQEIWTPEDFNKMKQALSSVYPYSNYYYQHVIGAGVCVFTKWSIEDIFFLRYSLNGYPYSVTQGDWYGGKGVGFAKITTEKGFKINLYVTHFVARYQLDHSKDTNEAHRMTQLLELMQFVKVTADSADAIIISGDFNMACAFPAMKLFRNYLGLGDAWPDNDAVPPLVPPEQHELDGATSDRADNPYRNEAWSQFYGNGERLDYIFYRAKSDLLASGVYSGFKLTCNSCWLDFREVPEDPKGLHYSDHEGVGAQFTLSKLSEKETLAGAVTPTTTSDDLEPLLHDIDARLILGVQRCTTGQWFHLVIAAVLAIVLGVLIVAVPFYKTLSVLMALSALLGAAIFAVLWGSIMGRRAEWRALKNARQLVAVILANLPKTLKGGETKQAGHGDIA